jgi:hypothetical protein
MFSSLAGLVIQPFTNVSTLQDAPSRPTYATGRSFIFHYSLPLRVFSFLFILQKSDYSFVGLFLVANILNMIMFQVNDSAMQVCCHWTSGLSVFSFAYFLVVCVRVICQSILLRRNL